MHPRRDTHLKTDTGLNNSDVIATDAESFHHSSVSKKYAHLTPLSSFSSEDLARLRRTSPDAYQALMQYEQLCRQNTAIIEAKEAELQRCIDVGQEVLGQLDQMQRRCSQLAKERDQALAKIREHHQHSKCHAMAGSGAGERDMNDKKKRPLMMAERSSREAELVLEKKKKEVQEREVEAAQLRQHAERLEQELKEQRGLYSTLKEDLQNSVEVARRVGAESDAAGAARRMAEASVMQLQRRLEERGLEVARSQAAQREAEDALRQLQLKCTAEFALRNDPKRPSIEMLAAATQLATLHNQLQDLIKQAGNSFSKRQQPSPAAFLLTTRMHVPTSGTIVTTTTAATTTNTTSSTSVNRTAGDDGATETATVEKLERWLFQSMEETALLLPELSSTLQHLEERLRQREADNTRMQSELQLALDEAQDLGRENMQLRKAFVALKEEMQALDVETERLRELGNLEVQRQIEQRVTALMDEKRMEQEAMQRKLEQARREGASEVALLYEQMERERHTVEREIRSLRLELSRWRDGEGTAAAASASTTFSRERGLQDMIEKLESENQRVRAKASKNVAELQAEIDRLEQVLQQNKSCFQRQIDENREEMERMMQTSRELQQEKGRIDVVVQELTDKLCASQDAGLLHQQRHEEEILRLTAEKDRLIQEKLERAGCVDEVTLLAEQQAKDETISALNRQLRVAEIEAAKLQDALHRASKKLKQFEDSTVATERYEELETELMQEREHAQSLTDSLATAETQKLELISRINRYKNSLQHSLRLLPQNTEMWRVRVISLLQEAARKATTRILTVVAEQEYPKPGFSSLPYSSLMREDVGDATPRQFTEKLTPMSKSQLPSGASSPVCPLSHIALTQQHHHQHRPSEANSASQTLSPPTSPVVDGDCRISDAHAVWLHTEQAVAFSSALQRFISDLTEAIDHVLLSPYASSWEAIRELQETLSSPMGELNTTQGPHSGEKEDGVVDGGLDIDAAAWGTVVSGIVDAYAEACAAVFQRICRSTMSYFMKREKEYHQSNRSLSASCEERVRCVTRGVAEREEETVVQLQTAQTRLLAAQRSADEAQTMLETATTKCQELEMHAEYLKEEHAAKQREWETERMQWRDTVAQLQSDRDTWRLRGEEFREQLERRVEELQGELIRAQTQLHGAREEGQRLCREAEAVQVDMRKKIHHLERELQEARASQERAGQSFQGIREQLVSSNAVFQQKLNEEAARVRQAEGVVVALQQELCDARAAQQALQRSRSSERQRTEALEEHSENLSRELEEHRSRAQVLEQRMIELHEAWLLQQKALDAGAQENEALQKVNHALEERLAEIEGDREPLRQRLQSLLQFNSC